MDYGWLVGQASHWWAVAAKAALMYVTALVGLRIGERRTLAQWTIIDFATAVAMGAVVGRTAIAGSQSYLTGAVALLTLILVHRLASLLRFRPLLGKLADHRVRVLVVHGELRRDQLRWCGLTDNDIYAQLRQRGVFDLAHVRYVLYESKGELTVVPETSGPMGPLVRRGLEASVGWVEPADDSPAAARRTTDE
ncbi:MAG TPA: YetF domain-containing protein [Propionibacteriaceae bacterium]|nr:YetF domain-containing protein [Propionibacteriaceae bacterium]